MTRAKKVKRARREQAPPPHDPAMSRGLILLALVAVIVALGTGTLLWKVGQGGGGSSADSLAPSEPGAGHVHGLGINPSDGALFMATHTGLFRVGRDEQEAKRVGTRLQDTMGFTVAGPNRFLGSGHPDIREAREKNLPPLLGLIESTDAGASWNPVSLLGEADFHVLRFAGERVYGYDASNDRLLASVNRGRTWDELDKPGPLIDFAAAPDSPLRLIASSAGGLAEGLFESRDGGRNWRQISRALGLIAWPTTKRLYLVGGEGRIYFSADAGRALAPRGEIGGQPAAFTAEGPVELYAAVHDGTIKRSSDGGATWEMRTTLQTAR
jgi:hypothetical protein